MLGTLNYFLWDFSHINRELGDFATFPQTRHRGVTSCTTTAVSLRLCQFICVVRPLPGANSWKEKRNNSEQQAGAELCQAQLRLS